MDYRNIRAVIFHLASQGKKPIDIHNELILTHGGKAPSKQTVCRWVNEWKWGRKDLENQKSPGRPPEAITAAKIKQAKNLIAINPKMSCNQLSHILHLAKDTTKSILTDHLGFEKLHARWVPFTLTDQHKRARVEHANEVLSQWKLRWSRFCARIVTVDETWIEYSTPLNRLTAAEWRPRGSDPPQLPRLRTERRKLMAIVFWDCEGIVHVEWFKATKERPGLNAAGYCDVLDNLMLSLREKRERKVKSGVLLLQDNAPCHTAAVTIRKLNDLQGFQ